MADASGAPRRVSMAYILGFSNKPFKNGGPPAPPPAPRHPSAFKRMVTTPGGVIEWAASDGRRGTLTGPGKPRLTTSNVAQVPDGNVPEVKAASEKVADEDDGGLFGGGLFGNVPAAPASVKVADGDNLADGTWTKEEDEKLLELRAANHKGPWASIADELGKKEHECKARFKVVKPNDWRPNNAGGGGCGGGKQKKGKQRDQMGQKIQQGGDNNPDEKKGENNASGDNPWVTGGANKDGDNQNSGGFKANTSNGWNTGGGGGGRVEWDTSAKNNGSGGFGDTTPAWGAGGGDSGGNDPERWDTDNNGGGNSGGGGGANGWENPAGGDAWGAPANNTSKDNTSKKSSSVKDSSSKKDVKSSSNKHYSQSVSKHRSSRSSDKASISVPAEYELKPDSIFSADDLRLIAKILQQDCSMVWDRVSWRFKDKTGRNVHPDVFEKKITGKIENRTDW
ncbi:uncharacterized protein M421DRAFT_302944 [Didymella exigua CBS 183.55]|uniref:Uncharacterized protein n=1 Tax=Didymella exigua CBS 183.55 TaxID=1150837 RepID=A0A6A5RDP4_9PLEO|nr:uncharacterized protein M421DRAFT_302944 [Didymella exigua CBS 183.55]KAF1923837.1 hypothetical protein M421DRAFT_302944 [Didymella exigua CBS 183.55]